MALVVLGIYRLEECTSDAGKLYPLSGWENLGLTVEVSNQLRKRAWVWR